MYPRNHKTVICNNWKLGPCRFGDNCRFAHGEHDLGSVGPSALDHAATPRAIKPELYKTQLCKWWMSEGACQHGVNCRFAHGEHELGVPGPPSESPRTLKPELYRTQLCKWWMTDGLCQHGANCRFAHGEHELLLAFSSIGTPPNLAKLKDKTFAHGEHEPEVAAPEALDPLRALKPELYKTQLCKWWMTGGLCQHGSNCRFAHGEHELTQPPNSGEAGPSRTAKPELFKTQLCKWWLSDGSCQHGSSCRFAHGDHELRSHMQNQAYGAGPPGQVPAHMGMRPMAPMQQVVRPGLPYATYPANSLVQGAWSAGAMQQSMPFYMPPAGPATTPGEPRSWGSADDTASCLNSGAIIDNERKASQLVDELENLLPGRRKLYLDFEGIELGRHGKMCVGMLTIPAASGPAPVYLLDFVVLPYLLEVRGTCNRTLRNILEDECWPKYMFDPRCDSDCLFHTCAGILMRGVVCLQICEVARDRLIGHERETVSTLTKVLAAHVPLHAQREVQDVRDRGLRLFVPEFGGRPAVFEDRPMLPELVAFCCVDVTYFELLERLLFTPLPDVYKAWVMRHSVERVGSCLVYNLTAARKDAMIAPPGP